MMEKIQSRSLTEQKVPPVTTITIEDFKEEIEKERKDQEIYQKIDGDVKMEKTRDLEENLSIIREWRANSAKQVQETSFIEKSKDKEYAELKVDIRLLYEEMYNVRDFLTIGGAITHHYLERLYDLSQLDIFLDDFAQFFNISRETLDQNIASFLDDYSHVSWQIQKYINAQPHENISIIDLKEYKDQLYAIRTNPNYQIFFKSYFVDEYMRKIPSKAKLSLRRGINQEKFLKDRNKMRRWLNSVTSM